MSAPAHYLADQAKWEAIQAARDMVEPLRLALADAVKIILHNNSTVTMPVEEYRAKLDSLAASLSKFT